MINMQQIPSRTFRINYTGGFALANSTELLTWLIRNNSGVHVDETSKLSRLTSTLSISSFVKNGRKILISNHCYPDLKTYFNRLITFRVSSIKSLRTDSLRVSAQIISAFMTRLKVLSSSWNISNQAV